MPEGFGGFGQRRHRQLLDELSLDARLLEKHRQDHPSAGAQRIGENRVGLGITGIAFGEDDVEGNRPGSFAAELMDQARMHPS